MAPMWIAVVLAVWAVLANALAFYFARESRAARRHAQIAVRMAAAAAKARVEMERNTPVMVMMGPDGRPAATAALGVARWWQN